MQDKPYATNGWKTTFSKRELVYKDKYYLYIINPNYDGGYKLIDNVTLTLDRLVYKKDELEATPIEDLGDYLISVEPVENPFETFLNLLED